MEKFILQVASWKGNHYSEWDDVTAGTEEELKEWLKEQSERIPYNWKGRIIKVIHEHDA